MKTAEETLKGLFEKCKASRPWSAYNFQYLSSGSKTHLTRFKEAPMLPMEDNTLSTYLLELGQANLLTLSIGGSLLMYAGENRKLLASNAATFSWRKTTSLPPHLLGKQIYEKAEGVYLWETAAVATPLQLAVICNYLHKSPSWIPYALELETSLRS